MQVAAKGRGLRGGSRLCQAGVGARWGWAAHRPASTPCAHLLLAQGRQRRAVGLAANDGGLPEVHLALCRRFRERGGVREAYDSWQRQTAAAAARSGRHLPVVGSRRAPTWPCRMRSSVFMAALAPCCRQVLSRGRTRLSRNMPSAGAAASLRQPQDGLNWCMTARLHNAPCLYTDRSKQADLARIEGSPRRRTQLVASGKHIQQPPHADRRTRHFVTSAPPLERGSFAQHVPRRLPMLQRRAASGSMLGAAAAVGGASGGGGRPRRPWPASRRAALLSVPNLVSYARAALLAAASASAAAGRPLSAWWLVASCLALDFADGWLARRLGQASGAAAMSALWPAGAMGPPSRCPLLATYMWPPRSRTRASAACPLRPRPPRLGRCWTC
jgi:hypothetical protein